MPDKQSEVVEPLNKDWKEIFDELIKRAVLPTDRAPNDRPLRLIVKQALTGVDAPHDEEKALIKAVRVLLSSSWIDSAFEGDPKSHELLSSELISAYLNERPWGALSELELARLWLRWSEHLCDVSSLHEEQLWSTLPSVKLSMWCELGLSAHLEEQLSALESAAPGEVIGLCLSGSGESAQLAFARRWFTSKGHEAMWLALDQATEKVSPKIALLDHLERRGREAYWLVSSWLAAPTTEARLLIWSDADGEAGEAEVGEETTPKLSRQIRAELSRYSHLNLDSLWGQGREQYLVDRRHPAWMERDSLSLTWVDELRLGSLIDSPPRNQPELHLSDLDAFAALIGPLVPLRVLSVATGSEEEVLRTLLNGSGWIEVDDCRLGGGIFTPSSALVWRSALAEGGRRAHRCAKALIDAIEVTYPPNERRAWSLSNSLGRLSRLRGRSRYIGQLETHFDLDLANEALRRLQLGLSAEKPRAMVMSAICGLAFDWARFGPIAGRWSEAIRAVELGVTAAERLKNPLLAARLSRLLGELALKDGRCALAGASLEVALKLSYALREAKIATSAALMLAEVKLLEGELNEAILKAQEAEKIARALSAPAEAWRARFRVGQLFATCGADQQARECWESLVPQGAQLEAPLSEAVITLYLELSSSAMRQSQYQLAHNYLSGLPSDRLEVRTLSEVCKAFVDGDDPTQILTESLIKQQQSRDIGAWFALQDWRAAITLYQHSQSLEVDSPLLSLKEARLGLELAVRVATGSRDRMRLIKIYDRLAEVYQASGQDEASQAAHAMSGAWREKVRYPSSVKVINKDKETPLISQETKEAARQEVESLISRWSESSLSDDLSQV